MFNVEVSEHLACNMWNNTIPGLHLETSAKSAARQGFGGWICGLGWDNGAETGVW